jgi:hypothetical protein
MDIERARTLYVTDLDTQGLRDAPFVGVYARQEAKTVLLVPWELGLINKPRVAKDPIYVFSSGRCGSTLLHNILTAAGINSVSEPDIACAILSSTYSTRPALRPVLRWATRNFVRDLVSALGNTTGPTVVKLRSQFCVAAPALLSGMRDRRTVFMIRHFEEWAQSVCHHFRVTPNDLLSEFRGSLLCYSYLRQYSNCFLVRYEHLVRDPYETLLQLSKFLGRDIPNTTIDQAMSVPAHENTRLERVTDRGRSRWERMRADTLRLWTESGTSELFEDLFERSRDG